MKIDRNKNKGNIRTNKIQKKQKIEKRNKTI